MRKPRPHGPYSIEELSNMDDDELGELYRTKDRTKEHYEFYDGFLDNVAMAFSSPVFLLDPDTILVVMVVHVSIILLSALAESIAFVIAAACAPLIIYAVIIIGTVLYSGIRSLFALIKNLPRFIRNRNWKRKGFDAFDRLYPHDHCKNVFAYLFSKCHNKYGHLDRWLSMIHKAIDEKVIHLYSNAEFGRLLKNILPALAYIEDTNKNLDEESFNVLDQEYGLTESMNEFMNASYSNAMDAIQKAEHAANSSGMAMDFVERNKERNRERLNRKAILDHSPDYKRIKDLNNRLKHSKNELENKEF